MTFRRGRGGEEGAGCRATVCVSHRYLGGSGSNLANPPVRFSGLWLQSVMMQRQIPTQIQHATVPAIVA